MRLVLDISSVGVLIALVAVLAGCSKQIETRYIRSPSGALTLRIEINEGGGAAVPDVTSAYVFASDSASDHASLIFRGSALDHFEANWQGSNLVALSYGTGYVSTCKRLERLSTGQEVRVSGC